jgi:hypothetical protein
MILGYQSACREWDRSRRNVAAYAVSTVLRPLPILRHLALNDLLKTG